VTVLVAIEVQDDESGHAAAADDSTKARTAW